MTTHDNGGAANLNHTEQWRGTGAGQLEYEISYWGKGTMNDGAGMWNYYVIITEAQLTPDAWSKVWLEPVRFYDRSAGYKSPVFDEYKSILNEAEWHGGITFYERRVSHDTKLRSIKVGCDYGHLWDRERCYHYDLAFVQREAEQTCKQLADLLKPLARCSYTGQHFDPAFIAEVIGYNGIISPAGLGARSAWDFNALEEKRAALLAERNKRSGS